MAAPSVSSISLPGSTLNATQQQVLFTNLPGHPTAEVPGIPGRVFKIGTSNDRFGNLYGSPNGNWIMTARTEADGASDEVLLVNGQLAFQEDIPAPWLGGTENSGSFGSRFDINDAGDYTLMVRMPSIVENHIVRNVGGVFQGIDLPGTPVPAFPSVSAGIENSAPSITADGTVAYSTERILGPFPSSQDELIVLGNQLLMHEGITEPTGQQLSPSRAFEELDDSTLSVSEDGAHWLAHASLTGDTQSGDVVIVDGEVVLQELAAVPGANFPNVIGLNGIFGASMDGAGNWYARGSIRFSGPDFVLRNGEVIARRDTPITPTTNEAWDDSAFSQLFFMNVGNTQGDYIVAGFTDAPSDRDMVVVKNGERVVLREGDPIDLDGNGVFDDNAFLRFLRSDRCHLTDDGSLFLEGRFQIGSAGTSFRGVIRIDTNAQEVGQPYCVAEVNSTGASASIGAFGSTEVVDNDLILMATGLPQNSFGFFITSLGQGLTPGPGGSAGNLCLSGQIGRFVGPGQILASGSSGMIELRVDLRELPQPSGSVTVQSLESWNFQTWYRDTVLGVPGSNFTNGVSVDFE